MEERPYTQFYARLLGGFSLSFNGEKLQLAGHIQTKYMQLMLMLLKAGKSGIERKKLIQFLRPDEADLGKGLNNLWQQVYLLRRVLDKSGLPPGKYIVPKQSLYFFSLDYEVDTDTARLDRLSYRIRNETLDEETRKQLLLQFCRLYGGEFLPMLGGEEWVALESAYYQKLYFDYLTDLCGILKRQGETEKLLELCTIASQLHPYDEWQAVQIDCLMSMHRYKEALKVYEEATGIFYQELGLSSMDQVMAKYRNAEGQLYYAASAITGIKEALQEDNIFDGPYCCSYPSFVDIYRVLVRMEERSKRVHTLMICTLDYSWEDAGGQGNAEKDHLSDFTPGVNQELPPELERKMELLRQTLLSGIRSEDVYTRYSGNQFLVLLIGANETNGRMIAKRLENNWLRISGDGNTKIEFTVQQADGPKIEEWKHEEKGKLHCPCC